LEKIENVETDVTASVFFCNQNMYVSMNMIVTTSIFTSIFEAKQEIRLSFKRNCILSSKIRFDKKHESLLKSISTNLTKS